MSKIIPILSYEEGYRAKPYIDSQGYPTVGVGILIGPKGAALSNYQFTLPKDVADLWLQSFVNSTIANMNATPSIYAAMKACNDARKDVLISMAYQMGINGLAQFKNTLASVAAGNFSAAAAGMLASAWARQTPNRAKRHAQVMTDSTYDAYKGLI